LTGGGKNRRCWGATDNFVRQGIMKIEGTGVLFGGRRGFGAKTTKRMLGRKPGGSDGVGTWSLGKC